MPRITMAAVALALILALTSCGSPAPSAGAAASPSPTPTPAPTPTLQVPVTQATLGPVAPDVPPVTVRIDAMGIAMPVIPVGVESEGFMELPEDPAVAGWYRYGPSPATAAGNTVISAHVDSPNYAIGPFASLRDVPAGAEVVVESADGTAARYATQSVTYYPKTSLPIDDIFARGGAPALILITCGGEFDRSTGHYRDNVVLVAKPVA